MPALSIQPTYPIFTDIDGQPLENGYVWIGTANLDPQTNPINVYWDDALTQLAAQPIRTRGGYPVNAGTPARLYVNSDYSIRVTNKNGAAIYNAPEATERISNAIISQIDSSLVNYTPAGTGAVATTVQAKLRETVSVKDFGAVGDGITDDTVAIQKALDAGGIGSTVLFPPGAYKINGTLIKHPGQILQGAGWSTVVGSYAIAGGSRLIQYNTTNIPLIKIYGASDAAQVERGGLRDIALLHSVTGATVGTGFQATNSRQEFLNNVYVAGFNTGIEQGVNCWQWLMQNVRVMDAAICLYSHDEGEDSTYIACVFRSYRTSGVGVKLNNMSQTNLFLGCDISNGQWGAILEQGDNGSSPYPMHATFINCQMEENTSGCILLSSSQQSAASSLHPAVTAIGCRAYAYSSPNSGQCFIFAQHASQIKVEQLISSGYSYGCVIGVNGYQGAYVIGTPVGSITWGNDAASTWGTSRFYGRTATITLIPGDRPITRLSSAALSYTAGNFTRVPFTTVVSDFPGWASSSSQGVIPLRAQTVRFKAQVYTASAPVGRYVALLYKNGSQIATLADVYVSTAGQPLTFGGEAFDVPNGSSDYYWVTIYSEASFTLDISSGTNFVAELSGS